MSTPLTPRQIWTLPFFLNLVGGIGVLAALLGDGIWDGVSWIALACPCLVILRYLIKPIRRM